MNAGREIVAVVTGDLVGSRNSEPKTVEAAMELLKAAAMDIDEWFDHHETRFTRFRGDGWQIHVAEYTHALRATIYIFARLRAAGLAIATRAAIGIGTADSLGTENLADARGTAFEASGRALDNLGRIHRLAIAGEHVTAFHRIIVRLIDELIGRWTKEQAEAVALYIHPDNPTLVEIAARIGITPQAVSYRLNGAGATVLRRALQEWEMAHEEQSLGAKRQ